MDFFLYRVPLDAPPVVTIAATLPNSSTLEVTTISAVDLDGVVPAAREVALISPYPGCAADNRAPVENLGLKPSWGRCKQALRAPARPFTSG